MMMYDRPESCNLHFGNSKGYKEVMKSMRAGTTVASSMKCGAFSSLSPLSPSGLLGVFGGCSLGVGISISNCERAFPKAG